MTRDKYERLFPDMVINIPKPTPSHRMAQVDAEVQHVERTVGGRRVDVDPSGRGLERIFLDTNGTSAGVDHDDAMRPFLGVY